MQKSSPTRTIQNIVCLTLMLIGLIGAYFEPSLTAFSFPAISFGALALAASLAIFFIIRRSVFKSRTSPRITRLTIAVLFAWALAYYAIGLLLVAPQAYGGDLDILINSSVAIAISTLLAVILTSIELFASTDR